MPYYAVTVHRTIRVEADSQAEAEFLGRLFTSYPETVDGIIHLTVSVESATPNTND